MAADIYHLVPSSVSANGIGTLIGNTLTTIHTPPAGTATTDIVELWATNPTTADIELTVRWGDSAAEIVQMIGFKRGIYPIAKLPINNALAIQGIGSVSGVRTFTRIYRVTPG